MIPTTITASDGNHAYLHLVEELLAAGAPVSPRGMNTLELTDVTIVIKHPARAIPTATSRRLRSGIGAVETTQLIAGISCLEQLDLVSGRRFSQFADQGRLRGAYGPRLYRQLPRLVHQLARDPDTRQAVVTVHRPDDLTPPIHRDVPCTVYLAARIRDGKLTLKAHMRSNDAWLGVPYDWWMFTGLQRALAWALDVPPGPYVHHVDSLHLYERDLPGARQLRPTGAVQSWDPHLTDGLPRQVTSSPDRALLNWARVRGKALEVCLPGEHPFGYATDQDWYAQHVPTGLEAGLTLCRCCRYVLPADDVVQHAKYGCLGYAEDGNLERAEDRKETDRV